MKFYFTLANKTKLKRSFSNLKVFSMISVDNVLETHGYSYDSIDEYGVYMISNLIENQISGFVKSKRSRGIIYSNTHIKESAIINMIECLKNYPRINSIVLIDDNSGRCEQYHHLFDEIIYISQVKKSRLIESNALCMEEGDL